MRLQPGDPAADGTDLPATRAGHGPQDATVGVETAERGAQPEKRPLQAAAGGLTFSKGMATSAVGKVPFSKGMATFAVGMVTFSKGMDTFAVGKATFSKGIDTFVVGKVTFSKGMAPFLRGMAPVDAFHTRCRALRGSWVARDASAHSARLTGEASRNSSPDFSHSLHPQTQTDRNKGAEKIVFALLFLSVSPQGMRNAG